MRQSLSTYISRYLFKSSGTDTVKFNTSTDRTKSVLFTQYLYELFMFFLLPASGAAPRTSTNKQIAVYWGQDPAGSLNLNPEKGLDYYCQNYDYDIISVAFLDVFFDNTNKGTVFYFSKGLSHFKQTSSK